MKLLKHENKKAIVILGGGLVKKKDGKWQTTNFNESDNFAVQGDRLRVVAGSYLLKDNPEQLLIVLGGKGQYKDISDVPTVAGVIKNELIELGAPAERIIKEEQSGNTYQQLQELKKIVKAYNLEKLIIVSNKYHLHRVQAMIERDAELQKMTAENKIILQSAEEILLEYEPVVWSKIIESAYESKAMQERIVLEKKGVKDIKEGKYKFE